MNSMAALGVELHTWLGGLFSKNFPKLYVFMRKLNYCYDPGRLVQEDEISPKSLSLSLCLPIRISHEVVF